jgi:hypothetical protein
VETARRRGRADRIGRVIPEVISTGIADWAAKAVSDLVGQKLRRPNLPLELRYRSYQGFRHAVLRALLALDLWTIARPTFVGAIWSRPVSLGSYRAYLRNMQEMVVQFSDVVCVGTTEIAGSAATVTQALTALTKQIHTPGLREPRRHVMQLPGYSDQRTEVLKALREFMVLSTADLGRSRPPRAASPAKAQE